MHLVPMASANKAPHKSSHILLGTNKTGEVYLASFERDMTAGVLKISDRLQLNQLFKEGNEKYCRWLPTEVRVVSIIPDYYDMHALYVEIEVMKGNAFYRPGCLFRLTPTQAFRAYEKSAMPEVG